MPGRQRKTLIPSRRRRVGEEEEDDSVVGEVNDDSLTEGSAISNDEEEADEGSEESIDDVESPTTTKSGTVAKRDGRRKSASKQMSLSRSNDAVTTRDNTAAPKSSRYRRKEADTKDVAGEGKITQATVEAADKTILEISPDEISLPKPVREQQDGQKPRREDPTFVPNKGGFFLHDDRTSSTPTSIRPFGRGRGRGGYPFQPQNSFVQPTDERWTHDLHDRHENSVPQASKPVQPLAIPTGPKESTPSPANAPNRSFSFSTILGNVTVHVLLPGTTDRKSVPGVVRKHHTLLPQHRPPLRRDKPVRISIPDQQPRYIFPSTERSFIFIPRALRPNQQAYYRGRGRGSFQNSRRTSLFGGSVYSPSAPMSRRSSIGLVNKDGLRSPAESTLSRTGTIGFDSSRPVVRLPSGGFLPHEAQILNGQGPIPMHPGGGMMQSMLPIQAGYTSAIPMHQPRPQKTVSVADIEAPSSLAFQPTQPQPFHQQMPAHVAAGQASDGGHTAISTPQGGLPRRTPLSHIPEGVVYAAPFQPFIGAGAAAFYPTPYTNMPVFYPHADGGMYYGMPVHGQALAPAFVPGMQSHATAFTSATGTPDQPANLMVHESNGMVYYIDQPQYGHAGGGNGTVPPYGVAAVPGMMGMGGMINVPGSYYYPSMPESMYYSTPSG